MCAIDLLRFCSFFLGGGDKQNTSVNGYRLCYEQISG